MGCPIDKLNHAITNIEKGVTYLQTTGNTYAISDRNIEDLEVALTQIGDLIVYLKSRRASAKRQ